MATVIVSEEAAAGTRSSALSAATLDIRRPKLVRWLLAGVVVGALAATGGSGTAAAAAGPSEFEIPPPVLAWGPCADGTPAPFECATAVVPLDYDRPAAGTISLALVRHPAENPQARIGTLFMNPGGPGGSGVDLAVGIYPELPQELRDRFDIVGFDPRGVARSDEVLCWNREEYDAAFAATQVLEGLPTFQEAFARARSFVHACVQRGGDLLPYIGTGYVARDMDLLRAAVGDDKLTYFGFSFGTFIGTVYANLFPERVRALTLDGAYDPVTYARRPYAYDRGQFVALERSLDHFLAWCSANPEPCGFGNGDAEEAFDRLIAELDANPVTVDTPEGPGTVNAATVLYDVSFTMNGGQAAWPSLGAALAEAERTNGAQPFQPTSTGLANFFAANTAVECADRAYPRGLRLSEQRLRQHARLGKRLGPLFAYGPPGYDHSHATACVQWPAFASDQAPSRYRGGFVARGVPSILVVGTTGDPDTPYPDAVALARRLADAELITLRGEGHSAFLRSACVTEQVVGYLVDLQEPETETCNDEPPPIAAAGAGAALAAAVP